MVSLYGKETLAKTLLEEHKEHVRPSLYLAEQLGILSESICKLLMQCLFMQGTEYLWKLEFFFWQRFAFKICGADIGSVHLLPTCSIFITAFGRYIKVEETGLWSYIIEWFEKTGFRHA